MSSMDNDERIDRICDDYLRSKGVDPDRLDLLSDKEFHELCIDSQIDAYLLGRLHAEQEKE